MSRPFSSGVVIGSDVDFMLENPVTVTCYKYVFGAFAHILCLPLLFFQGLNEISRGGRDRKLWILGRGASLDGSSSADGKLLYT